MHVCGVCVRVVPNEKSGRQIKKGDWKKKKKRKHEVSK